MAFSLDSKVKDILKNPAAAAVLDKYSPDASKNPQMKLVGGLTLLIPGTVSDLIGLVIVAGILALQLLQNKRERSEV